MRGPTPKPIEQKRLEGFPGHHPTPQPKLIGGRIRDGDEVPMPPDMNARESAAFVELLAPRVRAGLLDWSDLPALESAARSLAEIRETSVRMKSGKSWRAAVQRSKALAEFRQWSQIVVVGPGPRARAGIAGPIERRTLRDELGPRLRVVGDEA